MLWSSVTFDGERVVLFQADLTLFLKTRSSFLVPTSLGLVPLSTCQYDNTVTDSTNSTPFTLQQKSTENKRGENNEVGKGVENVESVTAWTRYYPLHRDKRNSKGSSSILVI